MPGATVADEQRGLVDALRALLGIAEKRRQHTARDSGLSMTQVLALLHLRDSGGLGQTALAERLSIASGTATAVIDRIEQRGLAVRSPHPGDRRRTRVTLTESGAETLAALEASFAAAIARLPHERLGPITESLRDLAAVLDEQPPCP